MAKKRIYKAQLIEICETGNLNFALVPDKKKGLIHSAFFASNLLPEGMQENDYAVIELFEDMRGKKYTTHLITEALIVKDNNPDLKYFEIKNIFQSVDTSLFFSH